MTIKLIGLLSVIVLAFILLCFALPVGIFLVLRRLAPNISVHLIALAVSGLMPVINLFLWIMDASAGPHYGGPAAQVTFVGWSSVFVLLFVVWPIGYQLLIRFALRKDK